MENFNFIPAKQLDNIIEENNCKIITYYGSSNHYFVFNDIIYFISDGCHVATKVKNKITYNPNFKFPKGIKKEMKEVNIF